MKKIIITAVAVCVLGAASLLSSCAGNTMTGGTDTSKPSESATENGTGGNIVDDAESIIEDMSEDATHGVSDGTPGGTTTRGSDRTIFPRGK